MLADKAGILGHKRTATTNRVEQVIISKGRRPVIKAIFALIIAALISACNQTAQVRPTLPATVEPQPLRGVLQRYDDRLWFQPCYERLWWPVLDYTAAAEVSPLHQRLAGGHDLYVEVDGAVDEQQQNQLLISQVNVAGGTAETCAYRIRDLSFRAANSSPYWVADIKQDSVTVKTANPLGRFSFLVDHQEDEQGLLYRQTRAVDDPFSIRLTRQRCDDRSTGTILAYRAEMILFGHTYPGCARRGHPLEEQLQGYYWYADRQGDQVVLNVSADQRVQLVRKDRAGRVISERGQWQLSRSGKLILSMKHSNGKEFVLLFRRQENGTLSLQSEQLGWAPARAAFLQWRPSGLSGGRRLPVAGEDLPEPLSDDNEIITVPGFEPVPAVPDGEQLKPITVTECHAEGDDPAC